jgi:exopolyphosphatase/guanosine-5'-triphosphate,3'-diphosphate pyrophosphatase
MGEGTVRIAAIDIGSDTVHLLVADATRDVDGIRVTKVEQDGELLLLGHVVARDGRIGTHAAALEDVVRRYVDRARGHAVRTVVGATEALRAASDGSEVVDRLADRVGLPIRILSGRREAALGLIGARHRLDAAGPQLLIDSGGASTELTLTLGRDAVASASLPVGAAGLGASLRGDPPEALSWALEGMQIGVCLALAPAGSPARAWATGGSAHNLAGLERAAAGGHGDGSRLTLADLAELAARLLAEPVEKVARKSGEDPKRVAILAPGLLILAGVLTHYGLDAVTVVPEGLREGMIAAVLDRGDDWWRDA